MSQTSTPKQRVLVYRTGHLGDTVCAIPAFRRVRQFFPDAELTLLCDCPQGAKVASADVVRHLGIFDRIETYTSNRGLLTAWELIRAVRSVRPDVALILAQLTDSPKNIRQKMRFFRLCGVKDARGHHIPFLEHDWQSTEAVRLIRLLHGMGVQGEKPAYDIPVDETARESVKAKLSSVGVAPDSPFLLFCGGGKASVQLWPFERYARVLPQIAAEMGWPVVAFGTSQEMDTYRDHLLPHFSDLKLLPASLSIPELFELCRMAAAYFGNETGPIHVAAAVDCPVAAVMCARAPLGSWHPDTPRSHVMRLNVECESCFLVDCVVEKHRCMTGLTEERVLTETLSFLRQLPNRKITAENN